MIGGKERMEQKRKKRFGDRRDGYKVDVPSLQKVMGYILPKRTDCEVFMMDSFDCTEVMKYLEKKNAEHPDYKTTFFHCVVTACARMVRERPKMNRFIQGWQMYERYDISLAFVAKRRFADSAGESLFFLTPEDTDTIDSISKKIIGDVSEMRKKDESDTEGIDKMLDIFASMPRPMLAAALRVVRYLDFWGVNLKAFTDGDPNYSTVFLSNLGSIKCPAVYHHLNNYGTNSLMITIGTLHDELVLMPDGTQQVRTKIDIGATLDERIADGFYFARSLKLIKHILANPELLDRPLGEPSGFDYDAKF